MIELFVMLTAPDGKYLAVAPANVVALRGRAPGVHDGLIHHGVHCVVHTCDGKFISVVETCRDVRAKFQTAGIENPTMGPVEAVPP